MHINSVDSVMKRTRTIFFSVLIVFVTQFAWGQGHDVSAPDPNYPVKSVRLFPNPATDYLSIKFEAPVARTAKLELHSIIGNSLEVECEIVDDYEIHVKVKDLPMGYYLLDVKNEGNQRNAFKFLKR